MCGIVGYIGNNDSKDVLLHGLDKLEYRGYDSAGVALLNENGVNLTKVKGRIAQLRESVDYSVHSTIGIGHTRWATHGAPSVSNAHPHQSVSGRFTIVHNGVVDNYQDLKKEYLADTELVSETDTEVIVQLIATFYEKYEDTLEAFRETMRLLSGSYAIAMIDAENEYTLYVSKNKSPLLIGMGTDFNVVTSDAMATLKETDKYLEIMDKEIVLVERDSVEVQNMDGMIMEREPFTTKIDAADTEKGTYPHYMLKEIDEQPIVMRNIINQYQDENNQLKLDEDIRHAMKEADRLYIIAAGTSYHAGLIGKDFLEKLAHIPVEVHVASEFSYNMPMLSEKPLFIFISQSGETADSRSVLVKVKEMGYPSLTITNVPGSTLSREANFTLPLHAGPEIAVASTKAYTAQIAVLAILAVDSMRVKEVDTDFDPMHELGIVANAMEMLTDQKEEIEQLAKEYLPTTRNAFFIGRGMDYKVALEGALKLKEISYVQAEGFAGGELKHGTMALIEEGTPVIVVATQSDVNYAIRSNVQETIARGANAMIISMKGLDQDTDAFVIPRVHELLTPLVSVIPTQLLAYYTALHRDRDVDKPRNLAKSVTVE